jgi:radical SAM superfamily enzyme YgiQ (UPF0313 family)
MQSRRRLIQIALDWTRAKDPPLSLGHASILANLKCHDITVFEKSWAVNHEMFDPMQVVDFAMQHAATDTDFAMGAYVWNEKAVQHILKTLKAQKFPGRLILGGPQVSYITDNMSLEHYYPEADVFVRGYAENVLLKLLQNNSSDIPALKGVHYRGIPDLGGTAAADLESLPSPFLMGLIKPQPFIRWETQRGCPFRCSFCQHREPDKDYLKRRYLGRSRIENEIQWIGDNPIINDVAVLDPTFNSGPYASETLNLLRLAGYKGKLALQCRADMIDAEFMRAVCELNKQAKVVLEFGLQTIHAEEQRLIERPTNLKKVTRAITHCIERGIAVEVSLIFGLPGQTLDSFKSSVEYCMSLNIPVIHAFPLMLLRGTSMFERKTALGLIESYEVASAAIDRQQHDIPHVVTGKNFSYEDWQKMAELAAWLEKAYNKKTSNSAVSSSLPFARLVSRQPNDMDVHP